MIIKRGDNVTVVEAKRATYSGNLMGERSVTCEISSPSPITFQLNDYVEMKLCNTIASSTVEYTEKFYIFSEASIKRNSSNATAGNAFEYTIKLYPAQYELQNMIEMRNIGDTEQGFYTFMSEYYLYGTVKDLCSGIIAVINQYKSASGIKKEISAVVESDNYTALSSLTGSTTSLYITKDNGKFYHYNGSSFVDCTSAWNIFIWSDSITTDCYQYSFNSTYVWNALAMVNNEEELDLDFSVIGRTILIGFPARTIKENGSDYQFQYQTGALFNLSKQFNESTGIVNRLRAYGSTKNVARYYNTTGRNTGRYIPRLMLPSFSEDNQTDYVQNTASQTKYGLREGSKNFDDIYPTIQNVLLSDMTTSSSSVKIYTIKALASASVVWIYGGVVSYDSNGNQSFTNCAPASKLSVTVHDYTASKDFVFDWNINDTFTRGSETYYGKIVQTSESSTDNLESSHSFAITDIVVSSQTERKKKDSTYQYCPYAYNANNPSSSDELNEIVSNTLIKNEDGEVTSFEIFIRDLGFDIDECYFSGGEYVWKNSGTPKFNMLDGLLGGLDFDLLEGGFERITASGDYATQYAAGARFKVTLCINTQNEYSNLPNDSLKCYAGDHFSIYNIDMPVIYVTLAENRLKDEADKYLADVCVPEYQYSMELDKITTIVNANISKQLVEGSVMKIHDVDVVGSTDVELPIQTITIEFNGADKGYNIGTGDADSISNSSKSTITSSAKRQASTFGNVVSTVVKTESQVQKLTKSSEIQSTKADYNSLQNKPQIAGTELTGNKSLEDLGIASENDVSVLSNEVASNASRITSTEYLASLLNEQLNIVGKRASKLESYFDLVNNDILNLRNGDFSGQVEAGSMVSDGGITAYAENAQEAGTILDQIPVDTATLDKSSGVLTVIGGGGGSGTSNYNALENKPTINGVTLAGNKTSAELGLDADKSYEWTQSTASSKWIIQHNLGKRPAVMVIDSEGMNLYGEISYYNQQTVHIQFASACTGVAYLN